MLGHEYGRLILLNDGERAVPISSVGGVVDATSGVTDAR